MSTMFSVGNQARNNPVLMVSVSIAKNTEMYNITDLISKADDRGWMSTTVLPKKIKCMCIHTY